MKLFLWEKSNCHHGNACLPCSSFYFARKWRKKKREKQSRGREHVSSPIYSRNRSVRNLHEDWYRHRSFFSLPGARKSETKRDSWTPSDWSLGLTTWSSLDDFTRVFWFCLVKRKPTCLRRKKHVEELRPIEDIQSAIFWSQPPTVTLQHRGIRKSQVNNSTTLFCKRQRSLPPHLTLELAVDSLVHRLSSPFPFTVHLSPIGTLIAQTHECEKEKKNERRIKRTLLSHFCLFSLWVRRYKKLSNIKS